MKYIIDVPCELIEDDGLLTFRSPYADVLTDIHAEPYTEPDRKAIEDEVWELADYVVRMGSQERNLCFGFKFTTEVTANLSYQEAKAKFEAWMKQEDEIHVGDEVIPMDTQYDTMIVTRIWKDDYLRGCLDTMGIDGSICSFLTSKVKKTGRHFPEVVELLKKMRGDSE